jgi:hypothetical protein
MSSPKAATAPARSRSASKPASNAPSLKGEDDALSNAAVRLAADIERALAQGRTDVLSAQALQALMGASCKFYAAQVEAGRDVLPLKPRTTVTPTDVMTTASGLLRAVNLAVFELGMWQSWTGR